MYFAEVLKFMPVLLANTKYSVLTSTREDSTYDSTWSSTPNSDWLSEFEAIFEARDAEARCRSSIQSAKTRPGADCGSHHELLITKFRLKLKKVGKTTRPLRHDQNQIPNNYTVEVRKRFKGLDLIDRVPDKLWMEVCDIVQETGSKSIPKKRNEKKQNGCLRRPYK